MNTVLFVNATIGFSENLFPVINDNDLIFKTFLYVPVYPVYSQTADLTCMVL